MGSPGREGPREDGFQGMADERLTFWEHLDVLRGSLLRMLAAAAAAALLAFAFKDQLFDVVLWPSTNGFVTYSLLGTAPFRIHLVNTGLTEQFMVHVRVALAAGALIASPYVIYLLFRFVAPALHERELKYTARLTAWAYAMFIAGVLASYFLAFPLTVRFLGTYQVSDSVENMLTITSYVNTLLGMSLAFGLVFEMPVLSWLLARWGLLRHEWMARYRRHAIVVILVVAAVVTPTTDMVTLIVVSLPMWLLYEASALVVKATTIAPGTTGNEG